MCKSGWENITLWTVSAELTHWEWLFLSWCIQPPRELYQISKQTVGWEDLLCFPPYHSSWGTKMSLHLSVKGNLGGWPILQLSWSPYLQEYSLSVHSVCIGINIITVVSPLLKMLLAFHYLQHEVQSFVNPCVTWFLRYCCSLRSCHSVLCTQHSRTKLFRFFKHVIQLFFHTCCLLCSEYPSFFALPPCFIRLTPHVVLVWI